MINQFWGAGGIKAGEIIDDGYIRLSNTVICNWIGSNKMHFSATKYNTSRKSEYMSEHKDLEWLPVTWEWNCTLRLIKGFFLHEHPVQT